MKARFMSILVISLLWVGFSQAQTNVNTDETLSLGIIVGDSFSYSMTVVLCSGPKLYLLLPPEDVGADFEEFLPTSFTITLTNIDPTNPGEFCWSFEPSSDCIYFYPKVELHFESAEYTGDSSLNLRPASGFITTNDWGKNKQYLDTQVSTVTDSTLDYSYTITEKSGYMHITSDVSGEIPTELNFLNVSSITSHEEIIYEKDSGVMQKTIRKLHLVMLDDSVQDTEFNIVLDGYTESEDTEASIPGFEFISLFSLLPFTLWNKRK